MCVIIVTEIDNKLDEAMYFGFAGGVYVFSDIMGFMMFYSSSRARA